MKFIIVHKEIMNSALYPGSFDPITYGHLDVIERMSSIFDPLWIIIAHSPWKQRYFSIEERVSLVKECTQHLPSVKVDYCEGLVIQYAQKNDIKIFIRSVRSLSDFDYEMEMSNNNKELFQECETLMVFTRSKYAHVSSKMVKEISANKGSVSHLVSPSVQKAILNKIKTNSK